MAFTRDIDGTRYYFIYQGDTVVLVRSERIHN
jgi:hypothetical protein